MYTFEWDEVKNQINVSKYGVSCEEAKLYFMMKKPCWSMTKTIQMRKIGSVSSDAAVRQIFCW